MKKKLHKGEKFLELATGNRKDLNKEEIEKIISQCFAGHEKQQERILLLKDGFVHLRTAYKPVYNEQKEVIAVIITSKDITREKDAESALKKSEEQWRFALEASSQGLWDWNMVTGDCYFSSSYKKLYGFGEHELKNHISEWETRTHPDDKILVQKAMEEHISNPDPYYECIYRVKAKKRPVQMDSFTRNDPGKR